MHQGQADAVVSETASNQSRPGQITSHGQDEDLHRVLAAVLECRVIEVIESENIVWRPAEAISKRTGIPVDYVRQILETTTAAEVLRAPFPNQQGYLLYTTRDHYRKLTPFLRRYAQVVRESS